MSALVRRSIVALTAMATGAFMVLFAVEHYRGRHRSKEQAQKLTTLIGTVYPHDHQKNL